LLSENSEVRRNYNFQSGSSLGSVKVHSFTLSHILKNMKCDPWASLLARTFASPNLGCEPKVNVVTLYLFIMKFISAKGCKLNLNTYQIDFEYV